MIRNRLFYYTKPFIPRKLQIALRRKIVAYKCKRYSHLWPIDERAGKAPKGWRGWPDEKKFALVLTHDVDTNAGHGKCLDLMGIEEKLGFRSSFNFVPERYNVTPKLRQRLVDRGFEVAVHGLKHDGKLYLTRKIFQQRALRINHYLKEWNSVGFNSPSMHRNLEWAHELEIEYDQSTFDTDPFEPQPDGIGTIFPFWIRGKVEGSGYTELPYTLPQDFTLFIILKENSVDIWKKKLEWLVERGGMVLLNTHPDYMNFDGNKLEIEEYPVRYYEQFLNYIRTKYKNQYWHVLPKEMARFWRENMVTKKAN